MNSSIILISSAGESSPDVATNAGSTDWLGHGQGQGSKLGSISRIGSQSMWISLSASACGSVLGSSQPSCSPWERGDLLRQLSTFQPANWFGKPKARVKFPFSPLLTCSTIISLIK